MTLELPITADDLTGQVTKQQKKGGAELWNMKAGVTSGNWKTADLIKPKKKKKTDCAVLIQPPFNTNYYPIIS